MPRRSRSRVSPRRSARRSTSIPPARSSARYRAFAAAFAAEAAADLLRGQGELEPRRAAPLRRARRRRRRRLRGRVAPRARRRRAAGADRLLRRRQDARTRWRRRSPPASIRSTSSSIPELRRLSDGRSGARPHRAGRAPGQSRCRRADPRQDLDRQEGEQIRHRPRRCGRGLPPRRRSCPASSRSALAVHIGSQLDRPRAVPRAPSSASPSWCSSCAARGFAGAPARSRRRPRHPLPRRDAAASRPIMPRWCARSSARSTSRWRSSRGACWSARPGCWSSRVVYVKEGATRRFVIVDAAMNDLIRPALYDAWHDIVPVRLPGAGAVVGAGRCRRPGLRDRRHLCRRARPAAARRRRSRRLDHRRRLWRGDELDLQQPAAGARGAGRRATALP